MQINPLDYEKLVLYWCHKCKAPLPVEDSEEYGDAWISLIKACKSYDPDRINPDSGKPYAFSTYASNAIKHAVWHRQNLRKSLKRGGVGWGEERQEIVGVWSIGNACCKLFESKYGGPSKGNTRNDDFDLTDYRSPERPSLDDRIECGFLLSVLSERFQRIVRDCLMDDIPIREVARREGLSHTRVIQILNRSLFLMRKASVGLVGASE